VSFNLGGLVGGLIGALIPGVGFAIGYAIGSVLRPPSTRQDGPRLDDLSVITGAYGQDIPTLYGRIATQGYVIWVKNNSIKENVNKKKVGGGVLGGGTTVRTYSYGATFAVLLCRAKPDAIISRLWLGPDLIFNNSTDYSEEDELSQLSSGNSSKYDFTFYDGSQTEADPNIVLDRGEDAPTYQGWCYLVFKDFPLKDFGNSISGVNVKAEIISAADWSVSKLEEKTISMDSAPSSFNAVPRMLLPEYAIAYDPYWDSSYLNKSYSQYIYQFNSVAYSSGLKSFTGAGPGSGYIFPSGLVDNKKYQFLYDSQLGVLDLEDYNYATNGYQIRNNVLVAGGLTNTSPETNDKIYRREISGSTTLSTSNTTSIELSHTELRAVGLSSDGEYVYSVEETTPILKRYDKNFNLLASIAVTNTPGSSGMGGATIWHDQKYVYYMSPSERKYIEVYKEDLSKLVTTIETDDGTLTEDTAEAAIKGFIYTRGYPKTDGSDFVFERWAINTNGLTFNLSDVVEDIGAQCGVTIDATELDTQSIVYRGYRTTKSPARTMLEQLQSTYLFDIVEDGYTLKCVTRQDKTSSQTIPKEDFITEQDGTKVRSEWEMADTLPRRIELNYYDPWREYDKNVQYGDYPTSSKSETSLEVPLSLESDEASQIANKLIKIAHTERQTFEFSLPQTYLNLRPADVVTIETDDKDYLVRLDEVSLTPETFVQVKATRTDPQDYQSSAVGVPGLLPDSIPWSRFESTTHLIDAPMIYPDDQDEPSFMSVMHGIGNWPGGTLYKSSVSGGLKEEVQGFARDNTSIVGTALGTLSSSDGALPEYNTTLRVVQDYGTFPTGHDIFTGEGMCYYGAAGRWEIMQYSNATTESDGTITLSGPFVRGRKGTEWETALHETGDTVIFIEPDGLTFIDDELGNIDDPQYFLSVTEGMEHEIDTEDEFAFTYQAINLKPLPPVLISCYYSSSQGDLKFDCLRRTRFDNSMWWTGGTPQDEASISYYLNMYDGAAYEEDNDRGVSSGDTLPLSYTKEQVEFNYGLPRTTYYFAMFQMSSRSEVGRGLPGRIGLTPTPWVAPTLATTFNTSKFSYSSDGLVATKIGSGRSRTRMFHGCPKDSGQYVIELSITGTLPSQAYVGLMGGGDKDEVVQRVGDQSYEYSCNGIGDFYTEAVFSGSGGVSWSSGDVITLMVDTDNDEFKLTVNGSSTKTFSISDSDTLMYPCYFGFSTPNNSVFTVVTGIASMTHAETLYPNAKELNND